MKKKESKITDQIRKEVKGLPDNYIILFVTDSEKYIETNMAILKIFLNEKKYSGIYITVNRPYITLVEFLKKNQIKLDNIFFIDCITKTGGGRPEITEDCLYLTSPHNLTELGIALTQAMDAMKGKPGKFLFLDSLSMMAIYNSFTTLAQFSHFLTTRIRLSKLKAGILISLEKEVDEKLLLILKELCDKVVEVR